MSPQQELSIGASEHKKIKAQFGFYDDPALTDYVREIGKRVTRNTERPDVNYRFFILDSPVVNAFALPGGYIYVSRGVLALAGSEAELAAVLAHEVAHITGRHSAERYSHGVLTSLGATVLSIALDNGAASQALNMGSNLYMSSYSRGQEQESDSLGLRYMSRGGYDSAAMSSFLASMQRQSMLESRIAGKKKGGASYFSTHPATSERVVQTRREAEAYSPGTGQGSVKRDAYLKAIDGMLYGDSARHGFTRGQDFVHPDMGFTFSVPPGYRIINQPSQVIATAKNGALILFDMVGRRGAADAMSYLTQIWMKGEPLSAPEAISINGMEGATASFSGKVDGKSVTIRLVAVKWGDKRFARFQIAIPRGASKSLLDELKRTTYSFKSLSAEEKERLKPQRLEIITARAGDSVSSLARLQPFTNLQEERFRTLNNLEVNEKVRVGERYKLISEN